MLGTLVTSFLLGQKAYFQGLLRLVSGGVFLIGTLDDLIHKRFHVMPMASLWSLGPCDSWGLSRGVAGRSNVGDWWQSLREPHLPNDGTTLRGVRVSITNAIVAPSGLLWHWKDSSMSTAIKS